MTSSPSGHVFPSCLHPILIPILHHSEVPNSYCCVCPFSPAVEIIPVIQGPAQILPSSEKILKSCNWQSREHPGIVEIGWILKSLTVICCITNCPKTWWLKTANILLFIVLWVGWTDPLLVSPGFIYVATFSW